MSKKIITTTTAPAAIGAYSQAITVANTVYFSGQLPLDPVSMELIAGDMSAQIAQVFKNINAVATAAGGGLEHIVKLTVFLTDLAHFPLVNTAMMQFFTAPYPARSTIGVAALPKNAAIEIEAIMVLPT